MIVEGYDDFLKRFSVTVFDYDHFKVVARIVQIGERLEASGQFDLDSLGGSVRWEEATVTLDSLQYFLAQPSRVTWDDRSLSIEGLEVRRDDHDHMRLTADGTLSRSDVSDFELLVEDSRSNLAVLRRRKMPARPPATLEPDG